MPGLRWWNLHVECARSCHSFSVQHQEETDLTKVFTVSGLKPTRYGLEAWDKVPKYMAKGYALHPQRRTWKCFEDWQDRRVETAQSPSPAIVSSVHISEGPASKMHFIPEPPGVKLCNDAPERASPVEKSRRDPPKTKVTKSDDCFGL